MTPPIPTPTPRAPIRISPESSPPAGLLRRSASPSTPISADPPLSPAPPSRRRQPALRRPAALKPPPLACPPTVPRPVAHRTCRPASWGSGALQPASLARPRLPG
ncbi:hypothetical protein PVAP13_8KG371304 [Panicum virgatum]|uniref:Uncharacterized protein n=1 Tax=Panicum virgatum TaxID=38727 RepID=A0A8T0PY94_PANVG|nr:hypothetical protein PVAP13_8KG371304 [Panicum virgatum]